MLAQMMYSLLSLNFRGLCSLENAVKDVIKSTDKFVIVCDSLEKSALSIYICEFINSTSDVLENTSILGKYLLKY